MRMSEQLQMKRHQVDFLRNIVMRDIPVNEDVRQALADLCKDNGLMIMSLSVRKPVHAFGK